MGKVYYLIVVFILCIACNNKRGLSDYEGSFIDVSSSSLETVYFEIKEDKLLYFTNGKGQMFVFTYNEELDLIECNFPEIGLYRLKLDVSGDLLRLVNEDMLIGVRQEYYPTYLEVKKKEIDILLEEVTTDVFED